MRPARLARARRARQLDHQRRRPSRRPRRQLVEEALDRRDVGEAVQPLAVRRAARPPSAARAASAPPAAPPTATARRARGPGCARSARRAMPLDSNTSDSAFSASTAACTSASLALEHRVARRLLVAAERQRVERQRIAVGHGVRLLDQHAEHARLEQRQRPHRASARRRSDAEAVVGLDHRAVDEVALVGAQHHQRRVEVLAACRCACAAASRSASCPARSASGGG